MTIRIAYAISGLISNKTRNSIHRLSQLKNFADHVFNESNKRIIIDFYCAFWDGIQSNATPWPNLPEWILPQFAVENLDDIKTVTHILCPKNVVISNVNNFLNQYKNTLLREYDPHLTHATDISQWYTFYRHVAKYVHAFSQLYHHDCVINSIPNAYDIIIRHRYDNMQIDHISIYDYIKNAFLFKRESLPNSIYCDLCEYTDSGAIRVDIADDIILNKTSVQNILIQNDWGFFGDGNSMMKTAQSYQHFINSSHNKSLFVPEIAWFHSLSQILSLRKNTHFKSLNKFSDLYYDNNGRNNQNRQNSHNTSEISSLPSDLDMSSFFNT